MADRRRGLVREQKWLLKEIKGFHLYSMKYRYVRIAKENEEKAVANSRGR
jgi:hypothetical protein